MKKAAVLLTLILAVAGAAWAGNGNGNGPCGGQSITNANHFSYSSLSLSTYTFNGTGGSSVQFSFIVTAPGGGQVFPGCNTLDTANFLVQDITEVADANGNPVDVDLDPSLGIGAGIAGAFAFSPTSYIFGIGASETVTVTLTNPNVASSGYGTYDVKLAAKDTVPTSTGIGVGSGAHLTLVLAAPLCSDTEAPTVTPVSPNGAEQKLGQVGVVFTAIDPDTPIGCGTGIVYMGYSVKSAGGTDHSSELGGLSYSVGAPAQPATLPQPAGVLVTATGTFNPKGWSGTDGTVNGAPFTNSFLSGIGTYTITETASDGTHTGTNTDTFSVDYIVSFTKELVTGGSGRGSCATRTGTNGQGCQVHLEFEVNRSNVTSDGAFMVDKTVAVALRTGATGSSPTASSYVAVHYFSSTCDNPHNYVDIQTTTGVAGCAAGADNLYDTMFTRGDLLNGTITSPGPYVADVWFLDVDGNWVLEGTSPGFTF